MNYNYYTVISVRNEIYDDVKDHILKYKKFDNSIIIEEYGQNGNHPHLNILFEMGNGVRTDSITRSIKKYIEKKNNIELTYNSVRTKDIKDKMNLLRYITKEQNCVVLRNTTSINLEEIGSSHNKIVKSSRWEHTLTLNDAPLYYVDYCEKFNLNPLYVDHNLHLMTKDKINVIAILRQIKVFRQIVKYLISDPDFECPSSLTMLDI